MALGTAMGNGSELVWVEERVVHIGEDLAATLGVDEPFGVDRVLAHRRIDDIEGAQMVAEPLLGVGDARPVMHDAGPVRG